LFGWDADTASPLWQFSHRFFLISDRLTAKSNEWSLIPSVTIHAALHELKIVPGEFMTCHEYADPQPSMKKIEPHLLITGLSVQDIHALLRADE
jgi:hypothetical protein